MAAARGLLPLSQEEVLESLVALRNDPDANIRATANETLDSMEPVRLLSIAQNTNAPPEVLGFLCIWQKATRELSEAVIINPSTPDAAVAQFASFTTNGSLLEAVTINQQRLIRSPQIMDSILRNPVCTPEAERLVRQIRKEFFEKERGQAQIANERGARAVSQTITIRTSEEVIELNLDDYLLKEFEKTHGPIAEDHVIDSTVETERIIKDAEAEGEEINHMRLSMVQRIAQMNVRHRALLALKGDREARTILIRDSNRSVCVAVLYNPRITEQEVEAASAMKSINEDALRVIGHNRAWTRSYTIIHNLVRNPRTPISITLTLLNRILTRDLRLLMQNKNVPDVVRQTSGRLFMTRTQGK